MDFARVFFISYIRTLVIFFILTIVIQSLEEDSLNIIIVYALSALKVFLFFIIFLCFRV